ncbi:MAG TPA: polysaccharide deacetylase family protein [bacterium]|nr:polysaccharide deacetylase family protein [bacterium]
MKAKWYILLYHNVSWEESPFTRGLFDTCPPDIFSDQLEHLSREGDFVSLNQGLESLRGGGPDRTCFSIFFDDGLADVRRYALPVMEQYGATGSISVCSRFMMRREFYWRAKMSYLSSIDGLRFLRSALKPLGYKTGMSIKKFTLDNFSPDLVSRIDDVFTLMTDERLRKTMFGIFDSPDSIRLLKEKGWDICNHTAAHYPVGEESSVGIFREQYEECESAIVDAFGQPSRFWVLPFDRPGRRAGGLMEQFNACGGDRYMALVENQPVKTLSRTINRIPVPVCRGAQLLRFLKSL